MQTVVMNTKKAAVSNKSKKIPPLLINFLLSMDDIIVLEC